MNTTRLAVAACAVCATTMALVGAVPTDGTSLRGWRVAELNGAPGLYHDGKPVPAMMFWQWEPQEKDTRELSAVGMDLFAMFGSFPHYRHPYWRKDGSFGMKYQDAHIDNLLSWAPKAAFLPRIFYTAPDWWSVANPGERHVFATPRKGAPARESFASLTCREELSPYYRKAVRHLIDRYGDHLMGIHVANGPCGEHFSWDVMLGGAGSSGSSWERVKRLTGGETYETLKIKSAAELRTLYKEAGVHVYTDSDVVLSANSAWLMLHTREAGDYTISLPRTARKITEITTEKAVAENADRFTWKLPKHATAVFLLE